MTAPPVRAPAPTSARRAPRSLRRRVAATAGVAGLLLTAVPGSAALGAPAPAAQVDCAASDWTIGAIRERYVALRGPCGFLGDPLTRETPTPVRRGAFNHFEGGSIYWSPGTGAHEVHGAIRAAWERQGWENSPVGFPLTDEVPTPDTFGAFSHFEAGSIYWAPTTGAYEVRGGIRAAWGYLGWENSILGFPTSDETVIPGVEAGAYNNFQSGSIYHSAATGAHEVRGLIRDKWVKLGSEKSVLGFPATNEIGTPGRPGAFNHFYNEQDGSVGSIFWSPATGAHMLRGPIRERWAQLGWEASALGFPAKDEYLLAGGGRRSDFQNGYITWRPSTGAVVHLSSASG